MTENGKGPRWRIERGNQVLAQCEQYRTVSIWKERDGVINTENPSTVADWISVTFGTEYDASGGYEMRGLEETGLGAVWAIKAPYVHGTGQQFEDTGIRVVDAWRHPAEVVKGQTADQFATELFEHELCGECAGDKADHTISKGPLGLWHAWCRFQAPRMARFVVGPDGPQRDGDTIRLRIAIEMADTAEELAKTTLFTDRSGVPMAVQYFESTEGMDDEVKEAAEVLLYNYRLKKHNES